MKTKIKKTPIKLSDLPIGSLFSRGTTIAVKSEYRSNNGGYECIIVGSGEYFHGGVREKDQGDLLVNQINLK